MNEKRLMVIAIAIVLAWFLILPIILMANGSQPRKVIYGATDTGSSDNTAYTSQRAQHLIGWHHTPSVSMTGTFTTFLPLVVTTGCSTSPSLLSPNNDADLNTINPLFRWDNGNDLHANTARMDVSTEPDFTFTQMSLWTRQAQGIAEFRRTVNFDPSTTYYWRTWLLCGDVEGPFSEVWSFTTGSDGVMLPAPMLISPPDGTTALSQTVTFEWSPIEGALEYLWGAKIPKGSFTYAWSDDNEVTLTFIRTVGMLEWRVAARNDYGIGQESSVWRIIIPDGSSSIQKRGPAVFMILENYDTIRELVR